MKNSNEAPICPKCNAVHPRCSGHRKRKNTGGKWVPCMLWPLKGRKGCKFHRDGINTGQANGRFKHGRYSRYMPQGIDQRIEELQNARREGEYLSLRDNIDLIEVRISQLVEQLGTADSKASWAEVRKARLDIAAAVKGGDFEKMNQGLRMLDALCIKGEKDYRSWDELARMQRHYNYLITSERKKLIEDKFMLSLEDVSMLMAMIGHAINEKVKDVDTRTALANEVRLISSKAGFEIA